MLMQNWNASTVTIADVLPKQWGHSLVVDCSSIAKIDSLLFLY